MVDGPGSEQVDRRLADLDDWRGQFLRRVRELVHQAVPEVDEDVKWAKATSPGVPVWSYDGILLTGEVYQGYAKLTFAQGASLDDPAGLFNASLEGATRRAIDVREGDELDESALLELFRAAADHNHARQAGRKRKA